MNKVTTLSLLFLCLISFAKLSAQVLPQALIIGDTTFCPDDSVQLFVVPGTYPRYLWSTGDTTNDPTLFASAAGSYWVRVIDTAGNVGPMSPTRSISQITPPAKPRILGQAAFCKNGSTSLTASPGNMPKYRWSTLDSSASIQVSQPGNYSLVAIDINGCESVLSDPFSVVENPLPPRPVIMGDSAICEGDSALVGLLAPFYTSYNWSNGAGSQSIWVKMADSLRISVTDTNGCQSPLSAVFIVRESMRPPPPAIGGDTVFCEGDSLQLFGPMGQTSYLWSTGATTPTVWVQSSGAYALRVTNAVGCISPFSQPWRISELPVPAMPVISPFGPDSLHANSHARSYIWLYNGQPLADSSEIIPANQSGVYQVIALNESCISDTSAAFSFVKTSLGEKLSDEFAIYPNPAKDRLYILFPQKRELEIAVMDIQGKKIMQQRLLLDASGLGELKLEGLAQGYYFLRIGAAWKKFLVKE